MGQGATVYRSSQGGAGMDLFRALTFALYHVCVRSTRELKLLKRNQPGMCGALKGMARRQP